MHGDDGLAEAVERMVAQVLRGSGRAAPAQADNFASDLALDALTSVLEVLRRDRPDQFERYRAMGQIALQD